MKCLDLFQIIYRIKNEKINIYIIALFLSSCSTYIENKKSVEFEPIHKEIIFKEEDNTIDGSIYNSTSSGFFASDRRAKSIGDILTVTLNESLSASKSTTNTTSKADTFGVTLPPLLFKWSSCWISCK